MPKYEIIASNRYSDKYIVIAKNAEQAREAVYDPDQFEDVEVDHTNSDCVGSEVFDCELIEGEAPEGIMCERCYGNGSFEVSKDCGVWKCKDCGAHAKYDGAEQEPGPMLARSYCGWAADGGDGVAQLRAAGENEEDDY